MFREINGGWGSQQIYWSDSAKSLDDYIATLKTGMIYYVTINNTVAKAWGLPNRTFFGEVWNYSANSKLIRLYNMDSGSGLGEMYQSLFWSGAWVYLHKKTKWEFT